MAIFVFRRSYPRGRRLISLAEAFQIDESINQVADLPRGFVMERTEAKGRWKVYSSSAVES